MVACPVDTVVSVDTCLLPVGPGDGGATCSGLTVHAESASAVSLACAATSSPQGRTQATYPGTTHRALFEGALGQGGQMPGRGVVYDTSCRAGHGPGKSKE